LRIRRAGEVGADAQGVGIGAAVQQRIAVVAGDRIVAGAGADAVSPAGADDGIDPGRPGDREALGLVAQIERGARGRHRHVFDVGDLAVAAAGEAGTHLQGVGAGAAIEQRVGLLTHDRVVARAGGHAVGSGTGIDRIGSIARRNSVNTGRPGDAEALGLIAQIERRASGGNHHVSMLAIWPSALLVKLAPTRSVSVSAPPSSSVSLSAPLMVSL